MLALQINAGASGSLPIALDVVDYVSLRAGLLAAMRGRFYSHVLMRDHLHLLVLILACDDLDEIKRWVRDALLEYQRGFLERHPKATLDFRDTGLIKCDEKHSVEEVIRSINYLHANPVDAKYVERAIAYPWSSAREYAGLSMMRTVQWQNLEAAIGFRGVSHCINRLGKTDLADPGARKIPTTTPELLLEAAAMVHGFSTLDLAGPRRSDELDLPRSLFITAARLEGYKMPQILPIIRREKSQAYDIMAKHPVDPAAILMVRTLIQNGWMQTGHKCPVYGEFSKKTA